MYLLINLEGVWEVKFELLNENVHVHSHSTIRTLPPKHPRD